MGSIAETQTSFQRPPQIGWPPLDEAAAAMAIIRADAEIEMCASLLADPWRAMPFAHSEGFTIGLLAQDDLRIMATAIESAGEQHARHEQCLTLIRDRLQFAGWWDDAAPIAPPFCSRWCAENLSKLSKMEYFCRTTISRNIARLKDIARRQEESRKHIAAAMAALTGEDFTPVMPKVRAAA